MIKPVAVRDRHGMFVVREDGFVRDGDHVQVGFHLMDGAGKTEATPLAERPEFLTDAERRAARDRTQGVYDAERRKLADAWRGGSQQPTPTLDARTEVAFRDGKIADTDRNRAMAELGQSLSDGWKTPRTAA